MSYYVPGAGETDPRKIILSLQQTAAAAASAGKIGEYYETVIQFGSAVNLSNGIAKNIGSLALPIGDWDVNATALFLPANTTSVTSLDASMSLVTDTIDVTPGRNLANFMNPTVFNGGSVYSLPLPPYRFPFAVATTIFFVALASFTVSTNVVFGIIRARRASPG